MPDFARLRSDLAAFAAAIGQPLAPWQAAALRLRKRTTVVAAPRQSGKSRALAVLSLWWCYRQPNQHALLISAGEDTSKRLLSMCAQCCRSGRSARAKIALSLTAAFSRAQKQFGSRYRVAGFGLLAALAPAQPRPSTSAFRRSGSPSRRSIWHASIGS